MATNPPVGYDYDAFPLNGGLDLITPKINAVKGTLIDCLNREVIDRVGYKRIDGFETFNGRVSPYQEDYYYVDSTTYTGTIGSDFSQTGVLVIEGTTNIFGIVMETEQFANTPTPGVTTSRVYYARLDESNEPFTGDQIAMLGNTTDFTVLSPGVKSCIEDLGETASEIVLRFNTYADLIRDNISIDPSLNTVPIGLHWFRDRLYAVVGDAWFYFDSGGTGELFVNQWVGPTSGDYRVTSVQVQSGTWAGGDAKGIVQVEPSVFHQIDFNNVNLNSYATEGSVTPVVTNVMTGAQASDFTDPPQPQYATLWQALSEQQAQEENGGPNNAGWDRIDLGYEADFIEGLSDTDGLTVVERGSDNNFTFVDDDEDQFPFAIFNGTNLVGTDFAANSRNPSTAERVDQGYPGWKTNASATLFADSDALISATNTDDTNYAYANVWYLSAGTANDNGGFDPGSLCALDNSIYGPVSSFNGRGAPTGFAGETDWFTTQARAPLILNDFSPVTALIPAGALIVGCEVIVAYDSLHYAEGQFAADRNGTNGANIVANNILWVNNNLQWGAQFCTSTSGTQADAMGEPDYSPILIQTTAGSYTSAITPTADTDSFTMSATLTAQSSTIGSSTSTFGVESLTRADLFDPALGIALFCQVTSNSAYPLTPPMTTVTPSGSENVLGQVRVKIDLITVRFHYTVPSARYYVGDGTGTSDVASIDVVYYVREDGSWSSGTASGKIQFTNIIPDITDPKYTVEAGDQLFLTPADAAAGTNPVLEFSSNADYNGLPSLSRIIDAASRYEFITANFFGRDGWDGFYGVSGAGRAFSFATYDADGNGGFENYLINITTNTNEEEEDIPRHVAYHHNALALGYGSGIVRFSVPGEPENFDGALGAAEIGVGDRVNGLLSMRGTTLGVYCENSIWGIVGTDADNYTTQVLAPYTGAVEYTVVDMGIPVFCDSRGISTLEQSAKYGNFQGVRLSAPVTPWITPRMIRSSAQFSGKGVACAIPVRTKNQYRVFFKDGKVLTMTINPDQAPSFTFFEYYAEQSSPDYFLVPLAWSSQVDENGVERLHFSHYSTLSLVQDPNLVYELDRGWGFAGTFIPAYYSINWFHKDPFSFSTAKKIRVDGLTSGISSCNVSTAEDYNVTYSTNTVDISLPKTPASSFSALPAPASNIANVQSRGRSLSFKVSNSEDETLGPLPPDTHQIMLVQFDSGGKIDA